MTDLQKITYKTTVTIAFSILVGFGSVCVTIGAVFGDWREWRKTITEDVSSLKAWHDSYTPTGNRSNKIVQSK